MSSDGPDPVDPNSALHRCPGCGSEDTQTLRRDEQGRVRCSLCADSVLLEARRIRRVSEAIELEASSHGSNYASGMRLARTIAEDELLAELRSAEGRSSRYTHDE